MEEGSKINDFFSEMIYEKDVPVFTTFGNSYGGRAHFSPHVGQVGHMVIIAPTGGGKTTLLTSSRPNSNVMEK
jgi:type IV secretion system protein VirB4